MKFCPNPNCKRELEDNTVICPYCKADTTGTVTMIPVVVPPPQPPPIPPDPPVPNPKEKPISHNQGVK